MSCLCYVEGDIVYKSPVEPIGQNWSDVTTQPQGKAGKWKGETHGSIVS